MIDRAGLSDAFDPYPSHRTSHTKIAQARDPKQCVSVCVCVFVCVCERTIYDNVEDGGDDDDDDDDEGPGGGGGRVG